MPNKILTLTKCFFDEDGSTYEGYELKCETETIFFAIEKSDDSGCMMVGSDGKCLMCGKLLNVDDLEVQDVEERKNKVSFRPSCDKCLNSNLIKGEDAGEAIYDVVGTGVYFYAVKRQHFHSVIAVRKYRTDLE